MTGLLAAWFSRVMNQTRLLSESRAALWLAAAALAFFLGYCAFHGWYVGGRPPGWFEGKHLVGPILVGAVLALGIAAVALALGCIGVWLAGMARRRRAGDWVAAAVAGLVALLLVANLAVPWGLGVLYAVARARQSFWIR